MAKRDKLTQRQKRQVAQKQSQRLRVEKQIPQLSELTAPKEGLLVARYGEQADIVDLSERQKYRCYLRQNLGSPVPGDLVKYRLANNGQGVVEAIHERRSVLQRPAQHQGVKPVVANIDRIFVVTAPLPDFSATLLDRYLVAVTDADIEVYIIANKWDLKDEIEKQHIQAQLDIYRSLGYPVISMSTQAGSDISQLTSAIANKKSILVGQSGVGKSSIINRLFPEQTQQVKQISENSRLGQHTTTNSQLFQLPDNDGFIIDSPGIREFGLWHMDWQTIAAGFVEFTDYLGSCKFRDCQHINEPGCQIIAAVDAGKITQQRWQNYCKIITFPQPQ